MGREGIRAGLRHRPRPHHVRAKAHIEDTKGGRSRHRRHRAPLPGEQGQPGREDRRARATRSASRGITDLRDESDRNRHAHRHRAQARRRPQVVLNNLYKYTSLQTTFGVIMLALVDGEPRTLSLKEMLHDYIDHQSEVITRRTQYDLEQGQERAHILEGLLIASTTSTRSSASSASAARRAGSASSRTKRSK
jgi:DNA gyrase subunit A